MAKPHNTIHCFYYNYHYTYNHNEVGAEGPVPRTTDWRVEVGVVVPVAAATAALENLTMVEGEEGR